MCPKRDAVAVCRLDVMAEQDSANPLSFLIQRGIASCAEQMAGDKGRNDKDNKKEKEKDKGGKSKRVKKKVKAKT